MDYTTNILRTVSIIAYLLIILMGIPFIFWLLFTIFDFGNIDQIFAILGMLGIVLNVIQWRNNVVITILSFLMMLSPLVSRMVQVPVEKFDYLLFQIPFFVFIICYLIFIILNSKRQHL
jgi:hypothetical protein